MSTRSFQAVTWAGIALLAALVSSGSVALLATRQATSPSQAVSLDPDDIGGVVTGPRGPEAGVWVIAETRELSTPYTKIVVTDDQGRYAMPDLPKANYSVWVR